MDYYWRRRAATIVQSWNPVRIVDVASGTGDLALAIRRKLPNAELTCVDFSPRMLDIARDKGIENIVVADALHLPFAAESFDCATVAFGLRNFEDWSGGVREMARVVKTGGHALIMDFSLPTWPILRVPYRFYLHRALPRIASLITGEVEAYKYLSESIEQFPSGDAMCELLKSNGFAHAQFERLSGGIVTIYTADKL